MMVAVVLLLTVVILGVVEIISRREDLRHLYVHFAMDTNWRSRGK